MIFKWQQNFYKIPKKVIFSLMAQPLPPSLIMAWPLVEELFCGFPNMLSLFLQFGPCCSYSVLSVQKIPCSPLLCRLLLLLCHLGADFKNNQTTKQVNNSIWTNRKQVKFCFYLPIGPNKNCLLVV